MARRQLTRACVSSSLQAKRAANTDPAAEAEAPVASIPAGAGVGTMNRMLARANSELIEGDADDGETLDL